MQAIVRQSVALATLNLKSIPLRLAMSVSAIAASAMAVAVLLGFLALSEGFRRTVQGGGSDAVAIVMRDGSESELNSVLSLEQARLVESAPGIARRNGAPLVSAELYLVVKGIKRSNGAKANITFRGVGAIPLAVRPVARLGSGRMFSPGTSEIVVGRGLQREFVGFDVGRDIRLTGRNWRIVGIVDAPGSAAESEIWVDARVAQGLFGRGATVQTVRVRLTEPAAFAAFKAYIENDPRLNLAARTERAYLQSQASRTSALIGSIGVPLAVIMAVGALVAALNTMYASVAARSREIATLRMIGFSGLAALVGTMVEALALSLLGAFVGAALYFVVFDNMTTSMVAQGSLTQIVFKLQLSPALLMQGALMGLAIGLVGGLLPGVRAARQNPQLAMARQ